MQPSFDASIHAKAVALTRTAIEITSEAGSGHPTSAASLAHLIAVLMYVHMRYDPAAPDHEAADRLVLSEGHACPIVYAAAADLGIAIGRDRRRPMTREDAFRLRDIDSEVDGHPNPREGFPFFPAATGSLGQGLSVAAGIAAAARLDGNRRRVFCIVGDGESREGQVWEALDFVAERSLTAVCPIFNCNGYGQTGQVSEQQSPEVLGRKLEAFGFTVLDLDGHDPTAIRDALVRHAALGDDLDARGIAIVARTVKGWGSPSLVGGDWHGKQLDGDVKDRALAELDATARQVGAADPASITLRPEPPTWRRPRPRKGNGAERAPGFAAALQAFDLSSHLEKGAMKTREAAGVALRVLGHHHPEVVVLDGDVGNSTYTELFGDDPDLAARFFQCRIAEQHMASCAGGLCAGGKTPFLATFGKFLLRAFDQLEMAFISGFPLRMIGSHSGVSLAADGPSQMALSDVAWFHAWTTVQRDDGRPFLYVLTPADARSAYALTIAMAEHDGAAYLRTLRPTLPLLYDDDAFPLGGHRVHGDGSDLLIVACGYMVHECLRALGDLAAAGVHATLVDLYSLPFDRAEIARRARECGRRVLTVEDNYGAGIGSAVALALAEDADDFELETMTVRRIPKSGREPAEVLQHVGLSARDVVERAARLAERG